MTNPSRQEQARWQADRYFGGSTVMQMVTTTGTFTDRVWHPEESRLYLVTISGPTDGFARFRPPVDARYLDLGGPMVTILHGTNSNAPLYVNDRGSTVLSLLQPGRSVQLYLTDNSTADGVWIACAGPTTDGVVRGPRTFLA